MRRRHLSDVQGSPTIGIITALPKEYAAVEVLLENTGEVLLPGEGANRRYMVGDVLLQHGGKHTVVLALLPIMGIAMAATRAARLLEHFPQVREIIMVGIAGGVPSPEKRDEHVRLGDIVVSDQYGIVQYDFVKRTTTTVVYRSLPRPPSANLLLAAKHLEVSRMKRERPWMPFIERAATHLGISRPSEATDVLISSAPPHEAIPHPEDSKRIVGEPRVFLGPIASANTLLKDPVLRDELRDRFSVKAVEMEGAGIADATWELGAGYFVIRGICDYCDSNKGDDWQEYAAIVAAGYTRALLESLPATSPKPHELTTLLNVSGNSFSSSVGKMRGPFMVEDLPTDFVPRPQEFHTLMEMLVDSKRKGVVAITAALRGAGGYGKTTMAKALCSSNSSMVSCVSGYMSIVNLSPRLSHTSTKP